MTKYIVHCLVTFIMYDTPNVLESPCLIAGLSLLYQEEDISVHNIRKFMYSIEEFTALSVATESENYEKNSDFWYVIDHLPIEDVILWAERLTKTKYLSNHSGDYWLDLIDLIRIAKQPMTMILTTKQKRYMCMLVISCWNDLECDYVI